MYAMRRLVSAVAVLTSVGFPAFADGCARPSSPPTVPDGATATVAQFKTAHPALEAYVHAIDAYRACIALMIKQAPNGTKPDDIKKMQDASAAALDESKTLSDAYLAQVKIFKTTGQGHSMSPSAPH